MRINTNDIKIAFTLFVFVAMASFDHAVIGLLPPMFSSISEDLKIDISLLSIISGVNFFVTALSSVVWGYLGDKGSRKNLIILGTIISSAAVYLTSFSNSFHELLIYQIIAGIGLGCIGSIGYSVLTDYIPHKWRGTLMSLWGMSQGFGGIAGAILASIVSTEYGWRTPFKIIAILSTIFMIFYMFIKEPSKGAQEPELMELIKEGYNYNYTIKFSHLWSILTKRTNIWLIIQSFFLNLTTGTLIWLPTMYASKIMLLGYSKEIAIIASGYLFAIFQIGGLFSMYFGYLGDILQRKFLKGRALLCSFTVFLAMPLYMLMFATPLKWVSFSDSNNSIVIFIEVVKQLFTNPWLLLMFVFSIGATAAQSANIPNWLALITDVNLPEHRATAFSFANLVAGTGRSVGNILIGQVLSFISVYYIAPTNYVITMVIFQLFFIPSSYFYYKVAQTGPRDSIHVRKIIRKRAKNH